MRRETYRPMSAASTATTSALSAMRQYRSSRAWLTLVSGIAVRTTRDHLAVLWSGTATYIMSSSSVGLWRIATPVPPGSACLNSGRSLWFTICAGTASESASTVPRGARRACPPEIRVMRVPDAAPRRLHEQSRAASGESACRSAPRPARARAAARACSSLSVCWM